VQKGCEIVGMGVRISLNSESWIGRIFVADHYRGIELGKEIVGFLCNRSREKGDNSVWLECLFPLKRFYEKLGFEIMGRTHLIEGKIQLNKRILPLDKFSNAGNPKKILMENNAIDYFNLIKLYSEICKEPIICLCSGERIVGLGTGYQGPIKKKLGPLVAVDFASFQSLVVNWNGQKRTIEIYEPLQEHLEWLKAVGIRNHSETLYRMRLGLVKKSIDPYRRDFFWASCSQISG
jgi:hypothetical protein